MRWSRDSGPGRWTPGPYTFVWIDALTRKVREGGRTVNVHCLVATGVNADGHREILGVDVTSSEDGAGWLAFLRGLVARGLDPDAHPGVRPVGRAVWRLVHRLPPWRVSFRGFGDPMNGPSVPRPMLPPLPAEQVIGRVFSPW